MSITSIKDFVLNTFKVITYTIQYILYTVFFTQNINKAHQQLYYEKN